MELSAIARKMISLIGWYSLLCILVAGLYYRSLLVVPFALGVSLATGLNVAKVFLLERTVARACEQGDQKGTKQAMHFHHLIRMALTGTVLLMAALIPQISLLGAALGVFIFQLAALSTRRAF